MAESQTELKQEDLDDMLIVNGRALRKLISYPEWGTFKRMIEDKIALETASLVTPAMDIGAVLTLERTKGAIVAFRHVLTQPSFMVEAMEELQKRRLEEQEIDE